jgi:hypothetical protein
MELPNCQAAEDSFSVMGARCFNEKILLNEIQLNTYKINKRYEITDKMEYLQFMNTLDKKPPHMGGRNNDWRELQTSSNLTAYFRPRRGGCYLR